MIAGRMEGPHGGNNRRDVHLRRQFKPDLPAATQLDINLSQQLRIEQGSVMHPHRPINGKAGAERIQAVFGTGKFRPGNRQRVSGAFGENRRLAAAFQLRIEERHVERGVVRDQMIVADKFQKFINNFGKFWLVGQKLTGQAVNGDNFSGNVALRIQVGMKGPPGFDAVNQLHTAYFNEPVPLRR